MNDRLTSTIQQTNSMDHTRVPMVEHIRNMRARGIVPYLSIGHRLGDAADPDIVDLLGRDLFASNTWISAVEYESALHDAERLAADAWGAEHSFYLVDGSSAGNHAVAMAALEPGDEVLVSRDLHWSLLVAIILVGAVPIYVSPDLDPQRDVGRGVTADSVDRLLDAHPNARMVMIVSPSWCGVSSEIAGIADAAHRRGIPLYVDEAWGPHFHFHRALPESAMSAGADAAVTSVHKILPAVSQGSVLHVRGSLIDRERLATAVRMMSTTSPMLPIVATLDAVRRQMAISGNSLLERVIRHARRARADLAGIAGFDVLSATDLGLESDRQDLTKLVIDVHRLGLSGHEVEQRLNREFSIAVESADRRGIVANLNLGDTEASTTKLIDALASIASGRTVSGPTMSADRATGNVITLPTQVMTPRAAYFSSSRRVRLADAEGAIAAELVTPYPPGIPVLAPGEIITRERIDYLMHIYAQGAVNYGNHTWSEDRWISVVDQE